MRVQEFIDNHILIQNPHPQCMRTNICQLAYKSHMNDLSKQGIDVNDYIKDKFFKDDNVKDVFIENQFPYSFDDKTLHYLLWINPLYSDEYDPGSIQPESVNNGINEIINNDDNGVNAFILFENIPSERTVLGIRHFHILFYNE